ncbi:MAG: TonB family protein [Spirochaetaceae bacterium]|nr:TonB family protein [Spirochaetaceae bacterium]
MVFDKVFAEHKLRKTRLAVFSFAAALHGILFFFVSVDYQSHAVIEWEETVPFKLVNIIEEAGPPELSMSVVREIGPPPPDIQRPEQKEPVENFIEIEEDLVEESVISEYEKNPIEEPASEQFASDRSEGSPDDENNDKAGDSKNSALALEYVKRNFDYISRRVRSRLVYPAQARRTGLDGTVEILFTLNTDGSVSGISVKKSAGAEMLDEAAIAAIKSAAPFRAPPVSTKLLIPVVFNLRQ